MKKTDWTIIFVTIFVLTIGTIGDYYIYNGTYTLAGCLKRNIYEVLLFTGGYITGRLATRKE